MWVFTKLEGSDVKMLSSCIKVSVSVFGAKSQDVSASAALYLKIYRPVC